MDKGDQRGNAPEQGLIGTGDAIQGGLSHYGWHLKLWLLGMNTTSTISSWRLADELHSTAQRLLRHARQADVITHIAPAQLSALSALVFGGPMTLGQLAATEQVSAASISRTIDALERRTLVRRARDKRDRRVIYAVATREGRQLLQVAREKRLQQLQRTLSDLSDRERDAIQQALASVNQCLARHCCTD